MPNNTAQTLGSKGDKTRQVILKAGETCFAQLGLQGTRVRDIASLANVNVATLYNYYKNKQALYEAVLEAGIQPIVEILIQHSSNINDIDEAAGLTIIEEVLGHLQKRPAVSKLIYLESINNGDYLSYLCETWFKPLTQEAFNYFDDSFDDAQKQHLISLFFHLSFGHFSLAPLANQVFDTDTTSEPGIQAHATFTLDLLKQIFPKLASDPQVQAEVEV